MSAPAVEVASVVRQFGPAFLDIYGPSVSTEQRRLLRDIAACRTAALGGHVGQCDACGHRQIAYNSCRNRHCPKCQGAARVEWTSRREAELLPVPYFHVVFTLPSELAPLALQNPRVVYGLLFQAAAETLQELAADPKHLGAEIGLLAVLHTWGQNLMHHPHLHCVVPAGGLSADGGRWISCRRSASTGKLFFLPVRVLSRVFRGKFLHYLKTAYSAGEIGFHGRLRALADPAAFERLLDASVRQEWVVYAKRPFGGPQQVLRYLARYTHRVAISNQRLLEISDTDVRFRWKDYADGGARKDMMLDGVEFLRRFLLHTLPSGFRRIRYYGFLANRHRAEKLAICRLALSVRESTGADLLADPTGAADELTIRCPACAAGKMLIVELVPRSRLPAPHFLTLFARVAATCDTS